MQRTVLLLLALHPVAAAARIENSLWRIDYSTGRAVATGMESAAKRTVYRSSADPDCPTSNDVWQGTPTALVGSLFSYFENVERYCGAHPWLSRRFITVDLDTGKAVGLLQWFKSTDLLSALVRDPFLRKTTATNRTFASLDALVGEYNSRNKDCLTFGDGKFQNFTFYDYDPISRRVAVRLQLKEKFSDCNPGFTQIGFWVTAPASLRSSLLEAKKKGQLMRYLKSQTSFPLR